MKVGRNEKCYCGSGLKYKNCCMNFDQNPITFYKSKAKEIAIKENLQQNIVDTYFTVLDFVYENEWRGACHSTSSVLAILLNEQGIQAIPCIGEIFINDVVTDHSWITIKNKTFDLAVLVTLLGPEYSSDPVFANIDLRTSKPTTIKYGINQDGLSEIAEYVNSISIVEYINRSKKEGMDLWALICDLGQKMNLSLDREILKQKYASLKWNYIK